MKVKKQNYLTKKIMYVMTILLVGFVSQANAQQGYTKYCNARYGFCVEYPVTFGMEPAPTNNDGRVFYDRDGFSMRVYGSYNALEHSFHDEMKEEKQEFDTITYKTAKHNWYVLSGYKDGMILYIKTYMSRDREIFYHLRISYPAKYKTEYNQIVAKASKSFKPGS